MFTKKHYEAIAETLRTLKNKDSFTTSEASELELVDIEMVITRFIDLFEDDNQLFNKDKFTNYINK